MAVPVVYLKNELYDRIIKAGQDPKQFVNEAVEEKLVKKGLKSK